MSTKQNLPNNPTTTANFTGEQGKMQELSSKYPRTTTGNLSYTSPTSTIVYNTATYDGGTYANQGEQGLFLVLQDALTENADIKRVLESMRTFAQRACRWQNDTNVDYKMAYNHYFGPKKAPAKS